MDDDFGWAGGVEVGGRHAERLLAEHLCTVHVAPCQQQVLDLQFDSLLLVLEPCGVVEVGTLLVSLLFLYTWLSRRTYYTMTGSEYLLFALCIIKSFRHDEIKQ